MRYDSLEGIIRIVDCRFFLEPESSAGSAGIQSESDPAAPSP